LASLLAAGYAQSRDDSGKTPAAYPRYARIRMAGRAGGMIGGPGGVWRGSIEGDGVW
jgi:hypothetical protein